MKAETRFPRTVEAYKAHLHEDRPHYDSFQTFCRKQGVGYKGVMQWMHRHNRSVGSLRLEVLSTKNRHKTQRKAKFYLNNWRSVFYMQGGLKQALA